LPAQGGLTGPKETRVVNRVALAIGQEHLQAHVNTNRRPVVYGPRLASLVGQFAHDERVPVSIGPLDQVTRLGRALDLAVALDLDSRSELTRHAQHTAIKPHILTFGE